MAQKMLRERTEAKGNSLNLQIDGKFYTANLRSFLYASLDLKQNIDRSYFILIYFNNFLFLFFMSKVYNHFFPLPFHNFNIPIGFSVKLKQVFMFSFISKIIRWLPLPLSLLISPINKFFSLITSSYSDIWHVIEELTLWPNSLHPFYGPLLYPFANLLTISRNSIDNFLPCILK